MNRTTITVPNEVMLESAAEMLLEGSAVIIKPRGNSMLPFIHGAIDSVKLEKQDTVDEGDIVLARLGGGRYVLHRVYVANDDNLTLMGDGNILGQEHCTVGDIIGTVTQIIRESGATVDTRSARHMRRARAWKRLLPLRRYILGVYRRLPWNREEITMNSK